MTSQWTNSSAFDLSLALKEAKQWIENCTSEKFSDPDNFHISTKDGRLLCILANKIKPGSIKKIHNFNQPKRLAPKTNNNNKENSFTREISFINIASSKFSEIDNIASFLRTCKELGLKDTLLFTPLDLHEGTIAGLRLVAVTLYWLARVAQSIGFEGPKMNLAIFGDLICLHCSKQITKNDQYVTTVNSQFHANCAVCSNCKITFTSHENIAVEGHSIFCKNCRDTKRSTEKLSKENQQIINEKLKRLTKEALKETMKDTIKQKDEIKLNKEEIKQKEEIKEIKEDENEEIEPKFEPESDDEIDFSDIKIGNNINSSDDDNDDNNNATDLEQIVFDVPSNEIPLQLQPEPENVFI